MFPKPGLRDVSIPLSAQILESGAHSEEDAGATQSCREELVNCVSWASVSVRVEVRLNKRLGGYASRRIVGICGREGERGGGPEDLGWSQW